MTTRDGLTLRADVYRPDAPGRFPVLLSQEGIVDDYRSPGRISDLSTLL
jgi:predicted acyl esterase